MIDLVFSGINASATITQRYFALEKGLEAQLADKHLDMGEEQE